MDVIDGSKKLFSDGLRQQFPELIAEVETWDDYHQNFFWAYVYKRFRQIYEAGYIRELEKAIIYGSNPARLVAGLAEQPSATPFKDAEDMIRPGSWFSGGNDRIITRT